MATSSLTPDQLIKRDVELGVHLVPKDDPPSKAVSASLGVAWMHDVSYDALVKKLLNAMMTNDHFFVVLGGHSAAAGHGNNFHQSYMMQFQELMEPGKHLLRYIIWGYVTTLRKCKGSTLFSYPQLLVF